ncbi:Ribonuclease 3 [subsurface metagenome]
MQEGTKSWGRSEQTYRNLVNEYFDKRGFDKPVFILDWEKGPPHSKLFGYSCQVIHNGDLMLGKGEGNTKKQARQEAARDLCKKLGLLPNN